MNPTSRTTSFAVLSLFCASAGAQTIPPGSTDQTLRYSATNTLAATDDFKVQADGGMLATDVATNSAWTYFFPPFYGSPPTGTIPATGPGARFLWYPAHAAIRAGVVQSSAWDDAYVGLYSTAFGTDTIASGAGATSIGGGNIASGNFSSALGTGTTASGYGSVALGDHTMAGGTDSSAFGASSLASGNYSTAFGFGASASGDYAVSMGTNTVASGHSSLATGYGTKASGAYSTALGAVADNNGMAEAFAYGDGSATTRNTLARQFMARASGGYVFYTNSGSAGAQLAAGSGSWTALSDRNEKDEVMSIDPAAVLQHVVAMPLSTWHYKTQNRQYRHLGPMAQDFYAAFHLGETDKGIDTVDADGVALAAIQALNAKLEQQAQQIAQLRDLLSQRGVAPN